MMLKRTGVRILVRLLVLGAVFGGISETSAGGIVIKGSGGTVGGTDPIAVFEFSVSLAPNYQWFENDYFTIKNLPGITPGSMSGYSGMYQFDKPMITLTDSNVPFASNVEWLNTTGTTISAGSGGLALGTFSIYTSVSLASLPPTVDYIALSHDPSGAPDSESGTITLTSVPEPSSVGLFLGGIGGVSLVLLRRRRCLSANPPCSA
jgi:hypothetical protein